MKKITSIILFLSYCIITQAQDTAINMNGTKIALAGKKASTIKLVDYDGKGIGNIYTYVSINSKEVVCSFYMNSKYEGIYQTTIQRFLMEDAKGLTPEIEVTKSFIDPEMKTSPRQCYSLSLMFRKPNREIAEIGSNDDIRSTDGVAVKQTYPGTSTLIPFATKKEADDCAAKISELFKNR